MFSPVTQELYITSRALDWRLANVEPGPAEGLGAEFAYAFDDALADGGVADDAAAADFFAAGFKLGFDEGDGFAAGREQAVYGGAGEGAGGEGWLFLTSPSPPD